MKKILIISNGNIGDFVMQTGALKLLRQSLPNNKITLIVSNRAKEFITELNLADDIIYTDFSFTGSFVGQFISRALWFIKNFIALRKANFDDCLFLDHSKFFAKIATLLKIKNLIGPSTYWCGNNIKNPYISSLNTVIELPQNSDKTHMSQRYQMMARTYTQSQNLFMPVLPKSKSIDKETAVKFLNKSKKYSMALCLCGDNIKGHKKIYPLSHTIELIKNLNSRISASFYFLGLKHYFQQAQKVKQAIPESDIHNLCSKTNIKELKALLEQIDLLICVDTGVIHIAAAVNAKIIGLYGHSMPQNSAPVSSKAEILYIKEKCSPCPYSRTILGIPCQYGDSPKCLENIAPEIVAERAITLLNS
jgi:heptosyltransferase-2